MYLLLTPRMALTPSSLVLVLPCPTMKVTSKKFNVKHSDDSKSIFLYIPAIVLSFLYRESKDSVSNLLSACKFGVAVFFFDLKDDFLSFCSNLLIFVIFLLSSGKLPSKWAKDRVKSLASCSCPSNRSRTESKSGLEGLMWPIGRQEPRLQ